MTRDDGAKSPYVQWRPCTGICEGRGVSSASTFETRASRRRLWRRSHGHKMRSSADGLQLWPTKASQHVCVTLTCRCSTCVWFHEWLSWTCRCARSPVVADCGTPVVFVVSLPIHLGAKMMECATVRGTCRRSRYRRRGLMIARSVACGLWERCASCAGLPRETDSKTAVSRLFVALDPLPALHREYLTDGCVFRVVSTPAQSMSDTSKEADGRLRA